MAKLIGNTVIPFIALVCAIATIIDFHSLINVSTGPGHDIDPVLFMENDSGGPNKYNNENNSKDNSKNDTLTGHDVYPGLFLENLSRSRYNKDHITFTAKPMKSLADDRKKTNMTMIELGANPVGDRSVQRPISDTKNIAHNATKQLPEIRIIIPTVRRIGDPNYLGRVLSAMEQRNFPLSNVFVFDLTNSSGDKSLEKNYHVRFSDARLRFPKARYATVTAKDIQDNHPPPPPGYFNNGSRYLPVDIQKTLNDAKWGKTLCVKASTDAPDRKNWRRKECYDFLFIARYVLSSSIYHPVNVSSNHGNVSLPEQSRNNASKDWIMLNQDDGMWQFRRDDPLYLVNQIFLTRGEIVKFYRQGAVAVAFREDHLRNIVELGQEWCNWLPVDWMITFYAKNNNVRIAQVPNRIAVEHIGKVSTKHGRLASYSPPEIHDNRFRRRHIKVKS